MVIGDAGVLQAVILELEVIGWRVTLEVHIDGYTYMGVLLEAGSSHSDGRETAMLVTAPLAFCEYRANGKRKL